MNSEIEIADRSFRPLAVRSNSLNAEQRTVDVTWSTGASVKRYAYDIGMYLEELSMDPAHIRLDRLNAGASFLDTHDQYSMASRLGAVVPGSARVENGIGIATIQISTSPAGEQLLGDLRQGLSLAVSVGYKTHSFERTEGDDDSLPVLRAIDWEPMEISAVPIPADPGAMARAEPKATTHRATVNDKRANRAVATQGVDMTKPIETVDTRADEIMTFSRNHNVPAKLAKKAIDGGKTLAEFREMALDAIIEEQDRTATFSVHSGSYGRREAPLSELMADGLMARLDHAHEPAEAARQYAGLPMSELARAALHGRGENTRAMSAGQLIERALHTTSDFPLALQAVGLRKLRGAYDSAPAEIKKIARQGTNRDFRPKSNLALTEAGGLTKVNEHGEFKRTTFIEGIEQYALESFGRIFGITRQALVNDDLGVFNDMPGRFGRLATEFEAGYIAALIERNPKMGDGKAVFHVDHNNLGAAAALSIASLSIARLAMRRQIGLNGELIAVAPRYLVVPPELETLAEQLLSTIAATSSDNVNPIRLELVVDARLANPKAWYLAADPVAFPSIEYAHLEGQEGPRLDQRVGFDVDGVEYKVALDFGAAVLDHRGLYKNPGL